MVVIAGALQGRKHFHHRWDIGGECPRLADSLPTIAPQTKLAAVEVNLDQAIVPDQLMHQGFLPQFVVRWPLENDATLAELYQRCNLEEIDHQCLKLLVKVIHMLLVFGIRLQSVSIKVLHCRTPRAR